MTENDKDAQETKLRVGENVYPFPSFDTLSYREAKRIKKETDIVMGEFFAALGKGDPDALIAIALTAKLRDNPRFNVDELYDLNLDDIEIIEPAPEPEVVDDGPLAEKPVELPPSSVDRTNDEPESDDATPSPS